MTIYDISVSISDRTPVYPGDPGIELTPVSRISAGEGANVSLLSFGTHTGTHIDPPYHFLEDGLKTDEVPLDLLIGKCLVCPLETAAAIGIDELEAAGIPDGTERILFKTRNSAFWEDPEFRKDFTYLDPAGANWLIERGIRLVGIDYLSVDRFKSGTHPSHLELLRAGVAIIEGINLAEVSRGSYTLVCLPLKIAGGDGGPARAVLISE